MRARLADTPGTAATATASASPAVVRIANGSGGIVVTGAMPSWPTKNSQACRPDSSPMGTPAASATAASVSAIQDTVARTWRGVKPRAQHRQIAAPAAHRREQQVRDRRQRQHAECEAEQQRQVLQLAEVHQVGRRGRAGDRERAELAEVRLERGEGLPGPDARPELDHQAIERRQRGARRRQGAQPGNGELRACAQLGRVAERREDRGPGDPERDPPRRRGELHADGAADVRADGCERALAEDDVARP